ncbi:lytic transglycosylase domain-containing protein [Candidatus Kaiserbacteria bacterium]|nr:lytic transglycosylase domain-containing protein [Candidatus Kaiserbacteria bacterium]
MKMRSLLCMLGALFVLPLLASAQGAATLVATPAGGVVPVSITFSTNQNSGTIFFGDGASLPVLIPACTAGATCPAGAVHQYTTAGAYTARLMQGSATVATRLVTIRTQAAPECRLVLTGTSNEYGSNILLSWGSIRATAGTIVGIGPVGSAGSVRVYPKTSGTYTGIFTGPGGTGRCAVSVTLLTTTTASGILGTPAIAFADMPTAQQPTYDSLLPSTNPNYPTASFRFDSIEGSATPTPDAPDYQTATFRIGAVGGAALPPSSDVTFRTETLNYQNIQFPTAAQTPSATFRFGDTITIPDATFRFGVPNLAVRAERADGFTVPVATFRGVPDAYKNTGTDATGQGQTQTQTQTQSSSAPGVNGLVGCNSAATCGLCAFTSLFQNIINFLIGLTVPLSALLFAWAGILYFTSVGSPERTGKAKKIFFTVAIGLIIAMGGWLGIQTLLKTVLAPGFYQDWNTIDCHQTFRPGAGGVGGGFSTVSQWLNFLPTLNLTPVVTDTAYNTAGGINTPYSAVDFSTGCRAGAALVNSQCYDAFGGVYDPVANTSTGCQSGDYLDGGQCMNSFGSTYSPYTLGNGANISSGAYGKCSPGYTYTESTEEYWCQGPGGVEDFKDVLPRTIGGSLAGTQQWTGQIEAACAQNANFSNCVQISRGIMAAESGGRTAVVSPAGAFGVMQMLPGTARQMDPGGTAGMSDAQIGQKLLNDPDYAINLGVKYAGAMNQQFGGSCELTAAAYNGGPRANNSSTTCPTQTFWQCSANRGYQETRNYVPRVCGS